MSAPFVGTRCQLTIGFIAEKLAVPGLFERGLGVCWGVKMFLGDKAVSGWTSGGCDRGVDSLGCSL